MFQLERSSLEVITGDIERVFFHGDEHDAIIMLSLFYMYISTPGDEGSAKPSSTVQNII